MKDTTGRIVDFILSCRVMGRKIEETMLHTIIEYGKSVGLETIYAEYKQTPKNKPCLAFWKNSGLDENADGCFTWKSGIEYGLPQCVQIEAKDEE